jgi:hypothetical protein
MTKDVLTQAILKYVKSLSLAIAIWNNRKIAVEKFVAQIVNAYWLTILE